MQPIDPNPRTVPPVTSEEQWNALVESIETEGDAIVESESGAKAVLISYEEFQEIREQRRKKQAAEAFERLQESMKKQELLSKDLSEEETERIAQEFSRDFYEDLADRGIINVRRIGKA